eukprot:1249592-Pyramimonas_sp.AAC.1
MSFASRASREQETLSRLISFCRPRNAREMRRRSRRVDNFLPSFAKLAHDSLAAATLQSRGGAAAA